MYKLYYWKYGKNSGNFGDELSPVIINKILGTEIPTTNDSGYQNKIISIGSSLHCAKNNDIIWGTGIRALPDNKHKYNYDTLRIHAVRGPITRNFLLKKKIECPEIYGDPALLYAKLFDIKKQESYEHEIGLVPHYTQYNDYKNNVFCKKKFKIIDVTNNYESVINEMNTCKYIISSSLHGIVLADSLQIPNILLYEKPLDEGILKFRDYYMSQKRLIKYVNNIKNYNKININEYSNTINLDRLLESFPKDEIVKSIT